MKSATRKDTPSIFSPMYSLPVLFIGSLVILAFYVSYQAGKPTHKFALNEFVRVELTGEKAQVIALPEKKLVKSNINNAYTILYADKSGKLHKIKLKEESISKIETIEHEESIDEENSNVGVFAGMILFTITILIIIALTSG